MSRPRLRTPGDGRNAPQGTDLPRAVGEKRRQRHFGIFIFSKSKRSSIGDCVFVLYKKRNVKLTNQYFKNNTKNLCPKVSKGRPESPLVGRWGKAPYSKMLRQLFLENVRFKLDNPEFYYRLDAPQDFATFIAPKVIFLLPSGKSQIASTPSSESTNARLSS